MSVRFYSAEVYCGTLIHIERETPQHKDTQAFENCCDGVFLQAECPSCPPTNSIKTPKNVSNSDLRHLSAIVGQEHVAKTVLTCHVVLHQLRTIRRAVSRSVLQSLVSSLVLLRLDYGNATLARQRLRSSSSSSLVVSRTRLSTVGDRAFPVATARVWNSLSDLVTSAPSVVVFWSRLKTHLFNIS